MGALASGGIRVINQDVVGQFRVAQHVMDAVAAEQQRELERREQTYRAGRERLDVSAKTVILIDDGLATGSTMRAAVQALRLSEARKIVVAVPVGAADTCQNLRDEADEVVCAESPEDFTAVGRWYIDFTQTTDEEVCELLNRAAHERRVERLLLGLRTAEGVPRRWLDAAEADRAVADGLAAARGERVALTERGMFVANDLVLSLAG